MFIMTIVIIFIIIIIPVSSKVNNKTYLLKLNNGNTEEGVNLFKVNNKDTRTTSLTSF